jgi:hypothetical protein
MSTALVGADVRSTAIPWGLLRTTTVEGGVRSASGASGPRAALIASTATADQY